MYTINVKTEVLPLLVIIGFPYGKLVKTMMFNIQQLFAEGEVIIVNIHRDEVEMNIHRNH
jgi:hypothetical protein